MHNYFTFADESSLDYGIGISGSGTFSKPPKRMEKLSIPGRNGDLFIEDGSFDNLPYTFPAYIVEDLPNRIDALAAFLLSQKGYQKITDSYHKDFFRMGVYQGGIDPTLGTLNAYGTFELVFDCKPQQFLLSGETVTTLSGNGTITNPTKFDAKPLIRAYGTGTITIGGEVLTITEADGYTDIDCDAEEAYKDSYAENRNDKIKLSGTNYPVLHAGTNNIALNGITKIEITPRWWTI